MQCACGPLYNIFPHYLINGTIFGKKATEHKICVFWFSLQVLFKIFLILRRSGRDIIKMYIGLHVEYRSLSSSFNVTWNTSTDCRKILKHQISLKFFQWEPSFSMRTDRRTAERHDEANSRFPEFCERTLEYKGFVSEEGAGHAVGPPRPNNCSGSTLSKNCQNPTRKCGGTHKFGWAPICTNH